MRQIIPNLFEIDEIGERVHCYLWVWQAGITLIDTGFPGDAETILAAIVKQGYALHNLRRIIITHVDLDHTGGLAVIKKATGARVACHTVEKALLEQPSRRQAAAWWLRPLLGVVSLFPGYHHPPVTPDELLVDGQQLPEGFTVIHTPGHTPGHISLLHKEKRFLITGDALSNRNNTLRDPIALFTPDVKNAQRSIWKLAKKYGDDFEVVAFGHGPPLLQNGGKRIKGLVSQIFSADV
ncbi:MAG: MBL fold metallo-hydrolase [Chloroflexota bacterium]|nr:MBL fold metallo-hydrolase [Chloroflexota bacterium]